MGRLLHVVYELPSHFLFAQSDTKVTSDLTTCGAPTECVVYVDVQCLTHFLSVQDEVLTVIRRVDENWAEGMLGDKIGIFPILYVEVNTHTATQNVHIFNYYRKSYKSFSDVAAGTPVLLYFYRSCCLVVHIFSRGADESTESPV